MKKLSLLLVLMMVISMNVWAQPKPFVVPLWEKGAPGFEDRKDEPEMAQDYWVRNIHNPNLTVFLPPADKANGTAVIVCPGGGMRELVYEAEGVDAAAYLNSIGVAAFVLKYRLPNEENSPYTIDNVREDGYRAMRLVRSRAAEWGIKPDHIGIMGFSAGAYVAQTVAYDPGDGDPNAADPIDRANGKPNFQIIVYPAPYGLPEVLPPDAPPALFIVAIDDEYDCASAVIQLITLYKDAKIPAEAHIYSQGKHAFNMGQRTKLISVKTWPERIEPWMIDNGIIPGKQ